MSFNHRWDVDDDDDEPIIPGIQLGTGGGQQPRQQSNSTIENPVSQIDRRGRGNTTPRFSFIKQQLKRKKTKIMDELANRQRRSNDVPNERLSDITEERVSYEDYGQRGAAEDGSDYGIDDEDPFLSFYDDYGDYAYDVESYAESNTSTLDGSDTDYSPIFLPAAA